MAPTWVCATAVVSAVKLGDGSPATSSVANKGKKLAHSSSFGPGLHFRRIMAEVGFSCCSAYERRQLVWHLCLHRHWRWMTRCLSCILHRLAVGLETKGVVAACSLLEPRLRLFLVRGQPCYILEITSLLRPIIPTLSGSLSRPHSLMTLDKAARLRHGSHQPVRVSSTLKPLGSLRT